uniref:FLYWCH-type domain-containing protein n=1 Tax=Panagrellus redivivus TaxID=6233 RepID=A0A7E4V736_PANRE
MGRKFANTSGAHDHLIATMYNFRNYDPATPRMVTSFKGNQKLIFEGYRYNIHHIVPAKNVKTWRCVCAKKLTSARSWCKGRAETWDNDSHGTSKGEHNHAAEHDVAELEFFKSQLILAAIDYPDAPLNDLIDAATSMMSAGVTFGSRESLKKSLTVARKSAENGGFKLKNYKNSSENTGSRTKAVSNIPRRTPEVFPKSLNLFENGTMASLLSLAKQCQETNNNNELDDTRSTPSVDEFQQSTSSASSILNNLNSLAADLDEDGPAAKMARFDPSSVTDGTMDNALTSILLGNLSNTFDTSGFASMGGLTSKDWGNSVSLDQSRSPSRRSTPLSVNGFDSPLYASTPNGSARRKPLDKAKQTARVNDIFNKLSTKAAAAASNTTTSESASTVSSPTKTFANSSTQTCVTETQTDSDGSQINIGSCLKSTDACGCRIIRVCCCSNETCARGVKRGRDSTE